MDIEKITEDIQELLTRADERRNQQHDSTGCLGPIILACGKLLEIIEDQQSRIEALDARLNEDPSTYDLRKGRK